MIKAIVMLVGIRSFSQVDYYIRNYIDAIRIMCICIYTYLLFIIIINLIIYYYNLIILL